MRSYVLAALMGTTIVCTAPASAQTATTFTYQGHLAQNGTPVDGAHEFEVRLLDSVSTQIGSTQAAFALVSGGAFTFGLDFGVAAFDGTERFLEISVRSFDLGGAYTTLSPNQRVASTPVAQFALSGNEGPAGPQGTTGAQGNPGPPGNDGAPGADGNEGAQGPIGPQGTPGTDGNDGADGAEGPVGPQGDQGAAGTPGDSHWSLSGVNTYFNAGNVGIGTSTPGYPLQVITNQDSAIWASTSGQAGVFGESTAASNISYGGRFIANSTEGSGVYGLATSSTGTNYGVFGRTFSPDGFAGYFQGGKNYFEGKVGIGTESPDYPLHVVSSNTTRSITATTFFSQGVGILGLAVDASGSNYGIVGRSMSTSGTGVFGAADASSGTNYGVRGETNSPDGYAGYFEGGKNYFSGNVGIGTNDPQYPLEISTNAERGVSISSSGKYGIYADMSSSSGSSFAGRYQSRSEFGGGLHALATHDSGVNYGIFAESYSANGFAGYFIGSKNYFNGKVGIGTASPSDKLHISVPAATDALRVQTDGITRIRVNANGGVALGGNSTIVEAGNTYVVNKLGIGTATPNVELVVNGTANITNKLTTGDDLVSLNDIIAWSQLTVGGFEAFTFDINCYGSAGKPGGGSWSVFSDERLKKNITSMSGSLDTIDALRPVNFEYKNDEHFSYLPGVQRGFIAQEVRGVLPQWVHTADDGYLYLDQIGYEALIVDAIQELRAEKDAENRELKDQMTLLLAQKNREIQQLQTRLDRLERMVVRSQKH